MYHLILELCFDNWQADFWSKIAPKIRKKGFSGRVFPRISQSASTNSMLCSSASSNAFMTSFEAPAFSIKNPSFITSSSGMKAPLVAVIRKLFNCDGTPHFFTSFLMYHIYNIYMIVSFIKKALRLFFQIQQGARSVGKVQITLFVAAQLSCQQRFGSHCQQQASHIWGCPV